MADGKSFERARRMRRALTPPEARLWVHLRQRRIGPRFRRQHPIGPYILDFYCPRAKLAVEVDGAAHGFDERIAHDARRTRWLAGRGIRVIRLAAEDVRLSLDDVVRWLADEIGSR